MFCPSCGTQNDSTANFCKQCGARLMQGAGAQQQGGARPPARKGCGCCSCSGFMFSCSLLFLILACFIGYTIYAGPEFINKFFAATTEQKTEMENLRISDDDAARFEKNISDFQSYIAKTATLEIHIKESEINSWMAKTIAAVAAKDPNAPVRIKILRSKLSPNGIRLMGEFKLMKFESYFAVAFKVAVNENRQLDFVMNESRLGYVKFPSQIINFIISQARSYYKVPAGSNKVTMGGVSFCVNKLDHQDGKIVVECSKAN